MALRELCAYGFWRVHFNQKEIDCNLPVDIEIASICAQYLDPGLDGVLFTINNADRKAVVAVHPYSAHYGQSLKLLHNKNGIRYDSLSWTELRLIRDILTSSTNHPFITEIECSSSAFGIDGARWISSVISNPSHSLQYINLPDCNLDIFSVQILVDSLARRDSKYPLWLDLSGNDQVDDDCIKLLATILPKLYCLRLSGCKITDQSLEYLNRFRRPNCSNVEGVGHPIAVHLGDNDAVDISKWRGLVVAESILVIAPHTAKDEWTGLWRADYGGHGMEYQYVHEAVDREGGRYLMARKITGDANVPTGKVTWKLKAVPSAKAVQTKLEMAREIVQCHHGRVTLDQLLNESPQRVRELHHAVLSMNTAAKNQTRGFLQIRQDPSNVHGFEWDDRVTLLEATRNELRLLWRYWTMAYRRVELSSHEETDPPISSNLTAESE